MAIQTVPAPDLTQFTAAELADPATNLGMPSFLDPRVFAVPATYTDRNTATLSRADTFVVNQTCDSPNYIVVGAGVTNEHLERNQPALWARYGVSLEQLQAARAGQVVMVRDAVGGAT